MLLTSYYYMYPLVVVGPLVLYFILLLLCIFAYIRRSPLDRNASLHQTVTVAIIGILHSVLALVSYYMVVPNIGLFLAGYFFGLLLTQLIWMVGILIFFSLNKGKRPLLVKLGLFFHFVQLVLNIATVALIAKAIDSGNSSQVPNAILDASNLILSVVCINWVFFLIFFGLVYQYRLSVTRKIMITLIIFGIINTVRLLIETLFVVKLSAVYAPKRIFILFFLNDFISAISLYMSTIYWKGLEYTQGLDF